MNKPYFFQMAVKEVAPEGASGHVRIRGYASTPDLDRYHDIVEPSAFEKALNLFKTNPVMLRSHDADRPVGEWDTFRVTEKGLWVEGVVKEKQTAEDVGNGLFKTLSIGYIPTVTELVIREADGSMRPFNWEEDSPWDANAVRVIKDLDLVEISIVSTPANPGALFSLAKSLEAFGRKLAFKSLNVKDMGSEVPANEAKPGEEAPSEAPVDADAPAEEGTAEEAKTTEPEAEAAPVEEAKADEPKVEETPVEPAPVEDGTNDEDESEEKSTETSQENAENAGETPAAEGGEDGNVDAPSADAAPVEEPAGDKSEESEGKAIIVTKDVTAALPELKASGAIREPQGEEKPEAMSKSVVAIMRKLTDALTAENKRANDEQKRADDLKATLDETPEKKALAPHRQFGSEEQADNKAGRSETSAWFKSLFTPKS